MHDRRIDGKAHTFGNQGGLYKRAMVWWDHETDSFWSQPTGTAILGAYRGVRLKLIPASIEPWGAWRREHVESLVLDQGFAYARLRQYDPFGGRGEKEVAGVLLGQQARGYYVDSVRKDVVFNDDLAGIPLVVYANPDDKALHVYVREAGGQELQFE